MVGTSNLGSWNGHWPGFITLPAGMSPQVYTHCIWGLWGLIRSKMGLVYLLGVSQNAGNTLKLPFHWSWRQTKMINTGLEWATGYRFFQVNWYGALQVICCPRFTQGTIHLSIINPSHPSLAKYRARHCWQRQGVKDGQSGVHMEEVFTCVHPICVEMITVQ